ncbi:MAG: TolC family protein [Alistipes sp.]|nr:TolC family protein [Candidatus Alistipes equi]
MKKIYSLSIFILLTGVLSAQSISHERFIKDVVEKNVSYLAEKYDIDIAEANVKAAKIFNDPELSVSYGNNQDWSIQMGQSIEVGLSYNPDLAGVRRARIQVAKTEKEITESALSAYLSSLRLQAEEAWAETWLKKKECELLQKNCNDMRMIAQSDSIRLSVGDVAQTDATQSALESRVLSQELIEKKAEYRNCLSVLSMLCGGSRIEDIECDTLSEQDVPINRSQMYTTATERRADLRAMELSMTLSEKNLKLVKATRAFELGLSLGYSYNTEVKNELAPAPIYNGLSVGISIPLKFSNFNRGEVTAAKNAVLKNRKMYDAALLEIRNEVDQACNMLEATKQIMAQYDESVLRDAKSIAENRKIGYTKGESSLVELLAAQQTYRSTMQGYFDACSKYYIAKQQLKKAVGY